MSGLDVRVARSVEQLEALRGAWGAMGFHTLDANLDVFLAVLRSRGSARRPHVLVAERDGSPVAMLAARLEDRVAEARFGYATVHRARMNCLTVVHGGVAGPGRAEAEPALVAKLLSALAVREADAAFFHKLEVGSSLHRAALRLTPASRRQRFLAVDRHWVRRLPPSLDELLATVPRRKTLQRYARKLQRELGDRLSVQRYRSPGDLERVLADLEAVARRTYQRGLDAGFNAEADRELVRVGLEGGWFNAWVLYVDGEPRAFEHGDIHGGTYFLGGKGYDPEWASRRVGNFVGLRVLEDLCTDPDVHELDFGFGDAEYKRELGDHSWDEADLTLYGPTVRATAVGALHSAVVGADRVARRAMGEEGVARIKRRWRAIRTPATS
jgi:CelD/BcsL family acetyltransferase involved in cellulose biosynthesis